MKVPGFRAELVVCGLGLRGLGLRVSGLRLRGLRFRAQGGLNSTYEYGGSGVKLYRCVFVFLRVYLVDMVVFHGRSEFQGRGI